MNNITSKDVKENIELKGIASELTKMQFCSIEQLNKMLSTIGYEVLPKKKHLHHENKN